MVSNGFSFIFCVDFVPHGLIWVFCDLQGGRESRIQEKTGKIQEKKIKPL